MDTSNSEKEHATDLESGVPSDGPSDPIPIPSTSPYDSKYEEINDPDIVWWDGPDDPANPRNWRASQKYITVFLVSMLCLIIPLSSSMFAPGVPLLMEDFHSTNAELASFVVSVFLLGFAVGPMFLSPMSEVFGRVPVYHVCNVLFTIFTACCGLSKNMGMIVAFRFLAGCMGAAPLAIGGGTIEDLIPQEDRGAAMATYSLGPMLGPIVGPIAGGYLSQSMGWRWNFWVITIIGGVLMILSFIFMRETYPKVILQKKTQRLRRETGNLKLRSKFDSGLSPTDYFKHAIIRPLKLLVLSPIVLALSLLIGLCFGCMYLLFCTYTMVFTDVYHWDTGTDGLAFLGQGIGAFLSLIIFGLTSDKILKWKAGGGELKPEYRLLPMIPAACFIPIGLFWYGWAAHAKAHWIVTILGTVFVGVGYFPVMMCVMTYLVDAFGMYSASAIAANTVIRSAMGGCIPLAGRQMYTKLGFGWGNSLLAFITTAMLPIPIPS